MDRYIGRVVHGYRNPGNSSEEIITGVTMIGNHCYDGTQHETAIKATTRHHPRPRWYVGYGGDYVPASKNDLYNIVNQIGADWIKTNTEEL